MVEIAFIFFEWKIMTQSKNLSSENSHKKKLTIFHCEEEFVSYWKRILIHFYTWSGFMLMEYPQNLECIRGFILSSFDRDDFALLVF